MRNQYSIPQLAAVLVGILLPVAVAAKTPLPPPPGASFDYPQGLSLRADPVLSGGANNLQAPLKVAVKYTAGTTTIQVFAAPVDVSQNRWNTHVYPPVATGLYSVELSSGGVVLATSTLVVGLRTLPGIELDALAPYDVADGKLLRFIIRTHGGEMGVAQFTFSFATTSADLSQVTLSGYTDPNYSQPIGSSTGPLADPADPTGSIFSVQPYTPVEIPANSSYYFELDGTVTPSDGTYSVETTLLGDPVSVPVADEPTVASTSNFVWSPNTYGEASTTSPDWVNGLSAVMPFNLVEVRHGTPVPQTTGCTLTSSTSTVSANQPFTLAWNTTLATSSKWDDGTVAALSGTRTITQGITATHTYILNVWGATGSGDCFVTVAIPKAVATSSPPAQGSLAATPLSGTVSLSVTFTGSVNLTSSCSAATYTLFYGDGGSSQIAVAKNLCKSKSFSFVHSYTKAGTVTAALYLGTSTTTGQLLQSQTITVNALAFIDGVSNAAGALLAVPGDILGWFIHLFWR